MNLLVLKFYRYSIKKKSQLFLSKIQLVQNPSPQNSIFDIQYFLHGCDCIANE